MRTRKSILLATDFSRPARRAFTHALSLASMLKARLILLHVIKAPPGFERGSPGARRSLNPLKTKALLELGRMARLATDHGVKAEHRLVTDIPEDGILDVAEETRADLIAIGTHGRTGLERFRLGSVAEEVLRRAGCPVLTVSAKIAVTDSLRGQQPTFRHFLVAMDFSAASDAALRTAAMLAEQLDARISLIHVFHPWTAAGQDGARVRQLKTRKLNQRARRLISASQMDLIGCNSIVTPGEVVEIILEQAKHMKANVIVMGTKGRRGVKRLVLGSVAEALVQRSKSPVLIINGSYQPRGL